ncbi:MAG TPA: DNA cytosine methyltransferase [Rubrivivax sp.]|nr:DNA cytosine methyltransferase [Rubrivivax sp.]HRZ59234.1 DNA cytosine methyltransferase [Rubrivivax sp.]
MFAGAGGIAEGFRMEGFRSVAASDIDPDACATFARNFPDAVVVHGDLRSPEVKAALSEAAGRADVVVGGPPCQAFSQVRNHARLIDDPRNSLYKEFVAIVARMLPPAFLMENVTGIDQMGFREQIAADLELSGEYSVLPQVIDAADLGVPQTRQRLVFIGVRRSLGVAVPRVPTTGATRAIALARSMRRGNFRYELETAEDMFAGTLAAALDDPDDMTVVSAAQAISDLECLTAGNRADELDYASLGRPASAYQRFMREGGAGVLHNVQVPRLREDTGLRLRAIPPGGNHRDLPEALMQRNLVGGKWGPENGSGRLSRRHYYAYRRLHPDIWSWTLNTKADSVYHYRALRSLSVREFARLHSFPDRFVFTTDCRPGPLLGRHDGGAAHSRYRQVGNAVPPLLARACAAAIRKAVFARTASREPIAA